MSDMHDDYHDDDYDYYDDEDGGWVKRGLGVAAIIAVTTGAAFVFGVLPPRSGGDDQIASRSEPVDGEPVDASGSQELVADPTQTRPTNSDSDDGTVRNIDDDEPEPTATDPADDDGDDNNGNGNDGELGPEPADTDAENDPVVSQASQDSDVSITDGSVTVPPTVPLTVPPSDPPPVQPSYPVLSDGSPVPVLGIYDGELITLSGVVPSEAAADRLRTLSLAFSKSPTAEVASFISVDPTVPVNVGVRVIEMNSARFPEGAPTISPEHARELDRVVAMMTAFPHVNTLVIGHADQRGGDEANFTLSTDRARTVSDYIAANGIDPSRLSSRGAGESDLLTLNNDEAALALNRRTEFVISGIFVDPPPPDTEIDEDVATGT